MLKMTDENNKNLQTPPLQWF